MFSWTWPWIFALLPLPLLVRWLTPAQRLNTAALRVPFFGQLKELQSGSGQGLRSAWLRALLLALVWVLLLAAAARPTWTGDAVPLPQEGRDLLLAVDISQSMAEEDMQVGNSYVSRIRAVKAVVADFIQRRSGDRIGLILFGEQGYLQTPLTFDRDTVETQLEEARLGFAGNATAIGDAIGLAVKRLRDRPSESRVLILLTDGANTAGTDPRQAAEVAAEAGIRIHTVGIGAERMEVSSIFGMNRTVNPSADLDEAALQHIASSTGGQYFRARDPAELETIYAQLDELEPIPEDVSYRPRISLFHWPLAGALVLSFLAVVGANLGRRGKA